MNYQKLRITDGVIKRRISLEIEIVNNVGNQYGIDTRGQAEIWREQSAYYPFYREMVDDSGITAPTIAGGALPNNPFKYKIRRFRRYIKC